MIRGFIITTLICAAAFVSPSAQEAASARSDAAEFNKLEPVLKFLRSRHARDYAITTPNGIDEEAYVQIGGIEQWITIRGEDRNNPVLLFLHGGPTSEAPQQHRPQQTKVRYTDPGVCPPLPRVNSC